MSEDQQPKIIVDDDWKSAARKEKERLAASESKASASGGAKESEGGISENVTFDDMIRMLATQALMYLGAFPDPETGKAMVALDIAKLHIDLMGVLEEKTKGNLTDEESQALKGTLHELRLQYVEIAKAVQKAAAEGRLDPGQAQGIRPDSAGGPGVHG